MPTFNNGSLLNFVPSEYYYMFCAGRHVDVEIYPYLKWDYDPSLKRQALHAVFDIRMEMHNGEPTSTVVITYKSVDSKSSHDVFVYSN